MTEIDIPRPDGRRRVARIFRHCILAGLLILPLGRARLFASDDPTPPSTVTEGSG